MKHFSLFLILFVGATQVKSQVNLKKLKTHYENTNCTESAPYFDGIQWWKDLASQTNQVTVAEFGLTDAGYPLHVITLSKQRMELKELGNSVKTILLINNAIHPGEPDGVDASMMFYRDVLNKHHALLDSCIVVCIPYYNIGGALNRSATSRANQDGPIEYGFRGNAQNLDLNRDFVKCDSRNARSFAKLLQLIDPDVYVETHVSNGADYQYNITYLSTQPDKLGYVMGDYLRQSFNPGLEKLMEQKEQAMVPYVNHHSGPLKNSYSTFYDSPRYSSGLTTLHNIFGFITETHMLKPYKQRVDATYDYLWSMLEFCASNSQQIKQSRIQQKNAIVLNDNYPVDWEIDKYDLRAMKFNGYEYAYKPSEVSGKDRLYYDRSKPITKDMFYIHRMVETKRRNKPAYYVLKQGFLDVADRLKWNGVELHPLKKDTTIEVTSIRIVNYKTVDKPYEKHYLHNNSLAIRDTTSTTFYAGDYLIPTGTENDRLLVELLEPEGPDSYFNWNFFDAILQQKEGFSAYVFEDKAAELLKNDSLLKKKFEDTKREILKNHEDWSANEQLYWIYQHSPYYEKEHNVLPVFRIE